MRADTCADNLQAMYRATNNIGIGFTVSLPDASSARQKFLRKQTVSLRRGERGVCATH